MRYLRPKLLESSVLSVWRQHSTVAYIVLNTILLLALHNSTDADMLIKFD